MAVDVEVVSDPVPGSVGLPTSTVEPGEGAQGKRPNWGIRSHRGTSQEARGTLALGKRTALPRQHAPTQKRTAICAHGRSGGSQHRGACPQHHGGACTPVGWRDLWTPNGPMAECPTGLAAHTHVGLRFSHRTWPLTAPRALGCFGNLDRQVGATPHHRAAGQRAAHGEPRASPE